MKHLELLGNLERPPIGDHRYLPTSDLWLPAKTTIDGDYLAWTMVCADSGTEPQFGGRVSPPADLLREFVRLAHARPLEIREFASQFGPLGICQHGLPSSHNADCVPEGMRRSRGHGGAESLDFTSIAREPVAAWHRFSGQMASVLKASVALHRGKRVPIDDMRAATDGTWAQGSMEGVDGNRDDYTDWQKYALALVVNTFLQWSATFLWLRWGERGFPETKRPSLILVQPGLRGTGVCGLFGVLAVQLMGEVTRSDSLFLCHACGQLYAPSRRPKPDQRHFCPVCREDGAAIRAAVHDYQQRRREKARNGKAKA